MSRGKMTVLALLGLLAVAVVTLSLITPRRDRGLRSAGAPPPLASNLAAATPAEVLTPTPTPGPFAVWVFEGKVFDILRQKPIEGVTIIGDSQPPAFSTTDSAGYYSLSVTVPEGSSGVHLGLSHPDYGTNYWTGDHTQEPYEQRIRMNDSAPIPGAHPGSAQQTTHLDFSMFPRKLTDDEEKRIRETLQPPTKD